MKMKIVMIALALTAATMLVAGCTSFGDNGTPSPTTTATAMPATGQNSVTPNPSQGGFTFTQSLTDAQKTQATSIALNNATVKDILNNAGYKVTGVTPAGTQYATEGMNVSTVLAIVSIEGGNTQHADGSSWTADQYSVFVDVNRNLVTSITHIEPKILPTPLPLSS